MEIPDAMINAQVNQMANEFAQRIQAQGLSVEQYFQFTGMDSAKFLENLKPQAIKRIESRLVLEAIVKAENIEVSEEELNKEIEDMAAAYKMEADKIRQMIGAELDIMKMDLAVQKAVDFVVEAAKEA